MDFVDVSDAVPWRECFPDLTAKDIPGHCLRGARVPGVLATLGNLDILKTPSIALFCSTKCPGDLILKTYDLACAWRAARQTVIGGFHSPMEKECLRLLLRGTQPVIVCPARTLPNRPGPPPQRPGN